TTASKMPQPRLRVLARIGVLPGQARRRKNKVADRHVVAHIAGTSADMLVQRFSDNLLDPVAFDRFALQALDQYGGRIDETRRAIAALETVVLEKGLLYRRWLRGARSAGFFGMPLYCADAAVGEKPHAGNAAAHRGAAAVFFVENDRAGMAHALPAAQLGAGKVGVLVQEVDHHQAFGHLDRTDLAAVDGKADRYGAQGHSMASCICSAVTGSE